MKKPSNPWDFIPCNDDTRYNFPVGAGKFYGKAAKNPMGKVRESSVVQPPRDKTNTKKPITT
jgi:hypothetical protein